MTGRVDRGVLMPNTEVDIIGQQRPQDHVVTVDGDVPQDSGQGGGGRQRRALLRGGHREDVERDRCSPSRAASRRTPSSWARCTCCARTRAAATGVLPGYRPQFYIRTMDVTGQITLEGVEMVMPGDNVNMKVELITPAAPEEGARFAIREGGLHRRRRRHYQDY